ncbi:hypothetical protein Bbelb_194730 [Branchiostoma belcheri]|nr:hypothetical protein Bbelb_194730 [Branchiostoma belcheri]
MKPRQKFQYLQYDMNCDKLSGTTSPSPPMFVDKFLTMCQPRLPLTQINRSAACNMTGIPEQISHNADFSGYFHDNFNVRKKRSSSPSSNESSPSQRRKQEDDQGTVAADDEFDFPNIEAHKLDTSVARGKAELSKRRSTKPRRKPTRQRSTSGNEDSNDFGFSIAPETKADNRQPAIANELNGSVDSLDREDVFNQNTVGAAVSPNRQPYAASAASAERLPSPDWVTVSFTQGQEPQMSPTKPGGVSLTDLELNY